MKRVFVTGASGRVGRTIIRAIEAREGFELVGGWCREAGEDLGLIAGIKPLGITASNTLEQGLADTNPDVVIDFSIPGILKESMELYLKFGLNAVIGTTGLTDEEFDSYKDRIAEKGLRWAAIPNYGLGISLVSDFIKRVRKYYPYVSISEQHTNEMANAPSGTAVALAKAASEGPSGPVSSKEVYKGVFGGEIYGVPVFSQRMPWPGPYAGHEITLARKDSFIKIKVEDHTSDAYMDGIFETAEKIGDLPAGTFVRSLAEIIDTM